MRTLITIALLAILSPAATNTIYLPLIASQPAPTVTPTLVPTITPTQTFTPQPTATNTPQPTPTATATQPAAVCLCDTNRYNCSDFSTQASAQACYDYCVSLGRGDVHKLDSNNDGIACEALPLWVQAWEGD